jgi:hypothetical protein
MSICPSPGKQRVDVCHRPAIDDFAEDVDEVGLRIEAVKLRGLCRPPNYAERACFPQDSR